MTVVFVITFALLAAAGLLTMVRLMRGPRTLDRVLATDVLVALILVGVTTGMAANLQGMNIALLLAVALLGFIGSISAVRLVERREEHR